LHAQLTPPTNATFEWTGLGGNSTWSDTANWSGGSEPTANNANVHFTSAPSGPETEVELPSGSPTTLRSLWFDATVANTLKGDDVLTLGFGLTTDKHMIVVRKNDGTSNDFNWGAETNIDPSIAIAASGTPRTRWIENQSEGGLGLNADLNLGASNLLIRGGQATRFGGNLSGTGSITITGPDGPSVATPTHLVLQGDNASTWSGALDIEFHAMGIVKSATALGSGTTTLHSGGTLAWRSHADGFLSTTAAAQPILVEGQGVVRQEGILPVGAIYNDGGSNTINDSITLTGDTWFGARGDIGGSLWLYGQISDGGAGHSFIKVGPGLIVLAEGWPPPAPEDRNTWGQTILRGGVLRIASATALPDANLELDGGILEFTWGTFNRDLGTGTDEIQWTGDGGFSASGSAGFSLNGGAALTWGQQYFVQDDHALLLGSRYSNGAMVTFTNALDLSTGSSHREIRVAETARAQLSGKLSGTNANTGLLKTGKGLLSLANTGNDYSGPTIIREGALRGTIHNNSNIFLEGGVLGLDANFTRNRYFGSGLNRIAWNGSGGFAAYGYDDRIVRIDNQTTSHIGWGWNGFVAHGAELRFGHSTANGTVIWDRALHLGNQMRTIRVERGQGFPPRADVVFNRELKTDGINVGLRLVGNGRADIAVANPNFKGSIHLFGAELRLHGTGTLAANPISFLIRNGGILAIDNLGTHNSDAGGSYNGNRIHDSSTITLEAGTISFRALDPNSSETLGTVALISGANELKLFSTQFVGGSLHIEELVRDIDSRATLEVSSDLGITLGEVAYYGINDDGGIEIIPWAISADSVDWLTLTGSEGAYSLGRLSGIDYESGPETGWSEAHNVGLNTTSGSLSDNRKINSLNLSGASLILNEHTLTLNAGGLLGGWTSSITGTSGSAITTTGRPLYIHNVGGDLTLSGHVAISGGMDVVKAKANTLILGSSATHSVHALYIHQGRIHLQNGTISTSGEIFIGDGASQTISGRIPGETNDILELPANRWNPLITPNPNVFPKITLHGTPYDPRGPEYGGGQAILRMGGNTKQRLSELHIQDRGTIDWVGGEVSRANILYLDKLTFSGPDAILFMRNWYEYEDYLLVKKGWFNGLTAAQQAQLKSQVWFEGYENFPVLHRDYNANYYQITPFLSREPEPATTGAILGAVGLGLWGWQRKRRRHINAPTT